MKAKERLAALREQMERCGMDVYLVTTSDFHASEYVGDYFKTRAYLTGFSGSAGTAVVTRESAGLWTDGRYFIQAEQELAGSGITLFRSGEPGVPTVEAYIAEQLPRQGVLGFDGRCVTAETYDTLQKTVEDKAAKISMDEDLIGRIWEERPAFAPGGVWILEEAYAGESAADKLSRIRGKMREAGAAGHVVTSLYDIAWILNLRGEDISHVPVFLSYLYITGERAVLYANTKGWSAEALTYLQETGVEVRAYEAFYRELSTITEKQILLDKCVVNALALQSIPGDAEVICAKNPSELMRAVKNAGEIANTKLAHRKDGVAVTKFICWMKTNIGRMEMDEISAAQKLLELRREQEHFLDVSFDTICAYGANAAMMHYSAKEGRCSAIAPEGFLLVDSGGHYSEGTTDITRTICLGALTPEMRRKYTLVLQGHIRLAMAKFPAGCFGQNLDALARMPLWNEGCDYRCGTGHGVGHVLNVHEGPNAFRSKFPETEKPCPLEPGMITTDEPGYYEEGAYGIRIENELLCVEAEKTEYGQFLAFDNITYAPIDLEPVEAGILTEEERGYLNRYHRMVRTTLEPYLNAEEQAWLKEATRPI